MAVPPLKTEKLLRVSPEGRIVIPAELRRKLNISHFVLMREYRGRVVLEPFLSMQEAFGTGGKDMLQVAREISKERRKEVQSERRTLST
jgi:AbrB family looped-hinge helix DNA binding protein